MVTEIAEALTGCSVADSRAVLISLVHANYHRAGGTFSCAVSALDTAIHDTLGHTFGVNVSTLIGGAARSTLTPYASGGYYTEHNDLARFKGELERAADQYPAAKIKCGRGYKDDVQRIQAARDVLGPDRALMVDLNGAYTVDSVIRLLPALHEADVEWLEEPLAPDDLAGLRRLRSFPTVPIAAGEALTTRASFRRLITEQLVDIVQLDVTKVGGIGEARAICTLADTWNLRVSPHVWGGAIGLAAAIQLLASMPSRVAAIADNDTYWLEYDRGENGLRDQLLTANIEVNNGVVHVPQRPGLGVAVDAAQIERFRASPGGT